MNPLGLRLGQGAPLTLGAFRRNPRTWVPGAVVAYWQKCARSVPGVEWPHCYFITDSTSGSIYCPACRAEVEASAEARRATTRRMLAESPF